MSLKIVRTVKELRTATQKARAQGDRIGLVPTMGALHHGHLSLVDQIAPVAETIVVSIFVNPSQFGEGEDFQAYPRNEAEDVKKLSGTNASIVYIPGVDEMYPEGDTTTVSVGGISENFEGAVRPGHFDGVATVVSKLLLQCQPDAAIFGEKDYQQLAVIRRFVRDLAIPVDIMGAPIIRESDGLAASSRNVYLSTQERFIAGKFNVMLNSATKALVSGQPVADVEKSTTAALLDAGFNAVDYVAVVCAETLTPLDKINKPARIVAAARLGSTRLLDNMAVPS